MRGWLPLTNLFNFSLNSSETDILISTIKRNIDEYYINVSDVEVFDTLRASKPQESNNSEFLKAPKSRGFLGNPDKTQGLSGFELMRIEDVYRQYDKNKEFFFLDSDKNPVSVETITIENYSGRIYDVDVPNDIVLVRRGNGSAFWSGNSNNGTVVNATSTSSGKFGGGFGFDGVNNWI